MLVVDLDSTLVRTDTLAESVLWLVKRDPLGLAGALPALVRGRAAFKAHVAERAAPDVATLPLREDVLALINSARAEGRAVWLVTAADQRIADRVAAHLGVFDAVQGSGDGRNLKGEAKARFLVETLGTGGFDYVGDSRADAAVWRHARRAITAGAGRAARRAAETAAYAVQHIQPDRGNLADYLRACRPHQWVKNVLVLVPVLSAQAFGLDVWRAALLAFLAFSLLASAVYVANDLLDLETDRAHPRKRYRPLAAGRVPLVHGAGMVVGLAGGALALAFAGLGWAFTGVLVGYFGLTTVYSLYLKRKLVVDVCALAGLYTVRVFAGGIATGIAVSAWLLAFSVFLFFALAAVKRQAELVAHDGAHGPGLVGRGYAATDLPVVSTMALASGYVAVLVLALYLQSDQVKAVYSQPELLWGLCVLLLYWLSRTVILTQRGQMTDDPIVFALKDRASLACGACALGLIVAGSVS